MPANQVTVLRRRLCGALALAEGGLRAMFVGKPHALAAGLLAAVLLGGAVLLAAPAAQKPESSRVAKGGVDRYGDPLPPGAVMRLGTVRYRFGGGYGFGGGGLAFLPDGETVVSVESGHPIELWEARTGRLLREVGPDKLSLDRAAPAFSRGGKRLAVSGSLEDAKLGWRSVVRVFDTASGKLLRAFERERMDGANALALSPDGELLFSLGREGKLRVEEVATGAELLRQKFPGDVAASLALSPDGSTLALASGPNSRRLFVWKWQAAEEPRELKTPEYRGQGVAFSPDGKLLADCSDSTPTVRVWDVASGRLLHKFELPDLEPYRHHRAVFSPDGKMLAASGRTNYRGSVHLWDPATGKFLKRLDVGDGTPAFSPDGKLLAASSRVWDFAAARELSANDAAHREAVTRMAAVGGVVATASDDHTVRVWDTATGKQRQCFVHGHWVRGIALSPDGSRLASSSLDDTVCLWDVATGRKVYRLAGHGKMGGSRAVGFAPDGKSFLTWGDDMYLRKWDVRTGKAVFEHAIRPTGLQVPDEEDDPGKAELLRMQFGPGDGCFTPDGKLLILQAARKFFLFDTASGKELRHFPYEGGFVLGMAVSPDSRLLLASVLGSSVRTKLPDGKMKVTPAKEHPVVWWDLATGKQRQQILLSAGRVGPVAFAPNGKLFAVACSGPAESIRLVEVPTGREVRKLEGFRGRVRSLAFLPDGRRLASGMDDGSALLWDLGR
jgi:WD40 repeat protein